MLKKSKNPKNFGWWSYQKIYALSAPKRPLKTNDVNMIRNFKHDHLLFHSLTLPPFPFAGAFPGPMGGPAAAALFRGAVPGGQGGPGGRGGAGGNPGTSSADQFQNRKLC